MPDSIFASATIHFRTMTTTKEAKNAVMSKDKRRETTGTGPIMASYAKRYVAELHKSDHADASTENLQ